MLGKLIKAEASAQIARGSLLPDQLLDFIDQKYNAFFGWTNTLSFVLQFLVVSRLVQGLGISRAFFILPAIALLDGLAVSALPVLAVLFVGKVVENSTDYSLNNTLRHMLWLPTTREMKYKAKQAVDSFFVRMGDVASGAWVVVGAGVLGLEIRGFALTNVLLAVLWLWLGVSIVRMHRELLASSAPLGGAAGETALS
jgi:AAA family ATP:ADP antiporter